MGHSWKHRLTNIDPERRRADCAECGPDSPIRRRSVSDDAPGWRCRPPSERRTGGRSTPESRARCKRRARAKMYGLTLEEYDAMVERQGNRCAICLSPPTRARLSVDHCHTTSKVRGMLCTNCNAAIGMFREDTEVMTRAIAYLKQHGG